MACSELAQQERGMDQALALVAAIGGASKKHLLVRFEEADDRAKAKKLARLAQALPATMANDDDDVGEDETLRAGDASVEQAPLRRQAGDAPNGD